MWLANSSKGCQSLTQMLRRGASPKRVHEVLADSHPAWLIAPLLLASLALADTWLAKGEVSLHTLVGAACVVSPAGRRWVLD